MSLTKSWVADPVSRPMNSEQVDQKNKRRSEKRLTISALVDEFPPIGRTTILTIVTAKLVYCTKMLTDQCKESKSNIKGAGVFGHDLQDEDDQTTVNAVHHSSSPKQKKFKQSCTIHKMMTTVVWGDRVVCLVELIERSFTFRLFFSVPTLPTVACWIMLQEWRGFRDFRYELIQYPGTEELKEMVVLCYEMCLEFTAITWNYVHSCLIPIE